MFEAHRLVHHSTLTTAGGLWDWGAARAGHADLHTLTPQPTSHTLHHTPHTLHLTPFTLHSTSSTLHPTPYTPHPAHPTPTPHTPHPASNTSPPRNQYRWPLGWGSCTRGACCTPHPTPYALHPHPTHYTLHPSGSEAGSCFRLIDSCMTHLGSDKLVVINSKFNSQLESDKSLIKSNHGRWRPGWASCMRGVS